MFTEVFFFFSLISLFALGLFIIDAGSERKIGWLLTLVLCIFATPLLAAIPVFLSKRKSEEAHDKFMRDTLVKMYNLIEEGQKKEDATS
jgi:hypothetical protein